MRWVFGLLLLANGFYYLWMETSGTAVAVKAVEPPPSVPNLVLLTELTEKAAPAAGVEPMAEAAPDEPAVPVGEVSQAEAPEACWQFGPFSRENDALTVLQVARERQWQVRKEAVEVPRPSGYWLYTGPYASRAQALERLREYKAKKIDSFLITDGDLTNAISLGLFSSRDRAAKAQAKRRKQGYVAKIYVLERKDEQQLVTVSGRRDEAARRELLQAVVDELKLEQGQKKSCI